MIQADLSNVGGYIGAVRGTLEAMEDPRFQGDFLGHIMSKVKVKFMVDAETARYTENLKHMYEWGEEQGEVSTIPLFRLTKAEAPGLGANSTSNVMAYQFLPSTQYVPLPDERYGIDPNIISKLSRHVFRMKAFVMESGETVDIAPKEGNSLGLFIPNEDAPKGYIWRREPVMNENPGGAASTGAFSLYWNTWFETEAQTIVHEESQYMQDKIVATGQKVIRYMAGTKINGVSVGGRFASARPITFGYIDAETKEAEEMALAELRTFMDEDYGDWDE